MNRKKIQRLWREEGLRVPQRKRKRLRLGESTVPAKRLRAERPNHVWALDFQFDTTTDGRTLKLLHVVDEHTREALAIRVARSIDADHTVRVLDQIVRERGSGPELIRMDNGPEMTANALRDWCRFGGAGRSFIEPGSPWQNPFVESFGSRVRDEVLSVEAFDSVLEAQTVMNDWKDIYNHQRPHSSLGWTPPAAYAASLTASVKRDQPDSHSGWTDKRGPVRAELTLGSDNGSAFTARRFRARLGELGVRHRRGGYRDPESPAFIESWFGKLKEREVWLNEYESLDDARRGTTVRVTGAATVPHPAGNEPRGCMQKV